MSATAIAVLSAFAYGLVSWFAKDVYPFSRYAMYADLLGRDQGAVLVIRLAGREVAFHDVVDWYGIDPASLDPADVPCSLQWVALEAQRWVQRHSVATPAAGALPVEVGYRILSIATGGQVDERFEPRGHGSARPRA
jgi:hypothetical protein